MRGEGDRWDAGVGDADIGETVDAKVRVNHATLFKREHCAC